MQSAVLARPHPSRSHIRLAAPCADDPAPEPANIRCRIPDRPGWRARDTPAGACRARSAEGCIVSCELLQVAIGLRVILYHSSGKFPHGVASSCLIGKSGKFDLRKVSGTGLDNEHLIGLIWLVGRWNSRGLLSRAGSRKAGIADGKCRVWRLAWLGQCRARSQKRENAEGELVAHRGHPSVCEARLNQCQRVSI